MKKSKNNRTTIMILILVGLLFVAYKVMFVAPVIDEGVVDENIMAGERVVQILNEIGSINFDQSIINDPKFSSLKNIAFPLPSLPVGKSNPFSANSN